MIYKQITKQNYKVEIEKPELYVDNKSRRRSGHMSHAMAEFAPGKFIDFNSNCSAERWGGHSPYGWIEYRISEDNGKTYSPIQTLPYSVECFLDGIHTISVEKAVACSDGAIVAFCLRNDATDQYCCEPWSTPMVVRSYDQGATWTEAEEYSEYEGRTYDALYKDGVIYVLHYCNKNFAGQYPEDKYRLYTSTDNGKTFNELSVIPFDTLNRGYGSILFDAEGKLHAYAYNEADESYLDHAVSYDSGKTWEILEACYVEKGARNPQTALIDGVYILIGRGKEYKGFVFYISDDGNTWDEGLFVEDDGSAFYSNILPLKDNKGNFLLVQYSESYDGARVNVKHLKIRINK